MLAAVLWRSLDRAADLAEGEELKHNGLSRYFAPTL